MPKFLVTDTFEVSGRPHFIVAGSIVEGDISVGMVVHVPLNSIVNMTARIHSIEFVRRHGGEDVCLCLDVGREFIQVWRVLNIADETLEISEDRLSEDTMQPNPIPQNLRPPPPSIYG